jgi:hypothetical protein
MHVGGWLDCHHALGRARPRRSAAEAPPLSAVDSVIQTEAVVAGGADESHRGVSPGHSDHVVVAEAVT